MSRKLVRIMRMEFRLTTANKAFVVLTILGVRAGQGYPLNFLVGALGGVLAISVYGLVNQALIRDWPWRLTWLEVIWGPIIGGLGGLFIAWLYRVI